MFYDCDYVQLIKIARPDSSQNFMNKAKTINLTGLYIQIYNTVVFFQSYTPQKTCQQNVNIKQKVLSYTIFRISLFRTTDIHRRTERLAQ